VARYQLYRLDDDNQRTKIAEVHGDSDGTALGEALLHTSNDASYAFCEGEREIAVIEVNDNRALFNRAYQPGASRPVTIRGFEFLFIAALAIGIGHALAGWQGLFGQVPESVQAIFACLVVLTYGLLATLCILTSRRRSVISMWLLLAIFALGATFTLRNVLDGRTAGVTPISVAQLCIELIALSLLFAPASRRWMQFAQ
jgi:hypothetical protein